MFEYALFVVLGIGYLCLAYPFVLITGMLAAWMSQIRDVVGIVLFGTAINLSWLLYVVRDIRMSSFGGDLLDAFVPYCGALIIGAGVGTLIRWMLAQHGTDICLDRHFVVSNPSDQ